MPTEKRIKNKRIIFPEISSSVIAEILEKYRLKETMGEVLKKLEKQKRTNGRIIAELVQKRASDEINSEEFIVGLKQELNITKKQAKEISQNLQEKILSNIKTNGGKIPDEILTGLSTKKQPVKKSPMRKKTEDIYRELLQ